MVFTSALIGDSTLLVRCAGHLLSQGLPISAIVTRNAQVADWAREQAIPVIPKDAAEASSAALERFEFDVLLSVANLDLLPTSLISRARHHAFNFHDGPLPAFAGLNAPLWALLEGRSQHAVTWHEMTATVDAGRIAITETIDIEASETTFSLNAKCYEAGFASFTRLVADLLDGGPRMTPQSSERRVLSRALRPAGGGLIEPGRDADSVDPLIRALDHGPYWNPVATAKVLAGSRAFKVTTCDRLIGSAPTAPAGTILAREPTAVVVAMGGSAVRLEGLATLDGSAIDARRIAELAPGQRLAGLDAVGKARLDSLVSASGKSEHTWLSVLAGAGTADLAYPVNSAGSELLLQDSAVDRAFIDVDLGAAASALAVTPEALLLAATQAWLARVGAGAEALLLIRTRCSREAVAGLEALFMAERPLRLAAPAATDGRTLALASTTALATLDRSGPVCRDLVGRLRLADAPVQGWPATLALVDFDGVGLAGDHPLAGDPGLSVVLDPVTRQARLEASPSRISAPILGAMARHLGQLVTAIAAAPAVAIGKLSLVTAAEAAILEAPNRASDRPVQVGLVDQAFRHQAAMTPDAVALAWQDRELTYREVEARVTRLADHLVAVGAGPGQRVAVALDRTPAMIVALLAILRAGAAYVPVDPRYPAERRALIIEDCDAVLLLVDVDRAATTTTPGTAGIVSLDCFGEPNATNPARSSAHLLDRAAAPAAREPSDLCYLTYTSGSTGRPKGVSVTHANVMAFLGAMDERIPHAQGGTWLAVTSISFDISVLELFWTLTRGFKVALASDVAAPPGSDHKVTRPAASEEKVPSLSLFYFADAGQSSATAGSADAYRLLLEGARFADAHGFEAVWTPERHFHAFGGIYPNPAVTGAAVAAVTRRVAIRAGSVVLPLHDPLRVAEDWSVIDNISGGRVGVAFASGWMPEDFVLRPDAFADRKRLMLDHVETIGRLWVGERIERTRPDGVTASVGTLPRPVQPRLPVWLTAARNPETFDIAGERGWNVLTHLLGMSVDEMAGNIRRYRDAWRKAGHIGEGRVTLMLHTFVGTDEARVREQVREPMKRYLASAVDIVRAAEWNFPTLTNKGEGGADAAKRRLNAAELTAEDLDAVLDHAFDRYYRSSGLFGTPATCAAFARRLSALGVDELACLVDFGVPAGDVLESLPALAEVLRELGSAAEAPLTAARQPVAGPASVAADLVRHGATHFQCTPSMAAMLLADAEGRAALSNLRAMLVGGEALPREMAARLVETVKGPVLNMYGPTETTVWSTSAVLDRSSPFVPLGTPILGTRIDVADPAGESLPLFAAGELVIAGAGVTDGYWRRPELTGERFVVRPGSGHTGLWYRTGDLVRRHADGAVEFLGRIDQQVKIRGHRIEPGEIESVLLAAPGVREAAVVAIARPSGAELAAFVTPVSGASLAPEALTRHLAARLPAIMVPAEISVLQRMPQTANGKLDRKDLASSKTSSGRAATAQPVEAARAAAPPALSIPAYASRPELTRPSGSAPELEAAIARIWSRLLGVDSVSPVQNFFDLGGHSLLAVELHRTLATELGLELKLTDIFRFPTVAGLAAHAGRGRVLAAGGSASEALPAAPPASPGQDRARLRLEMARRGRAAARPAVDPPVPAKGGPRD